MNKKIIALAVATAFAAPMAAQADAKVYGKINLGVASIDTGATTDVDTDGTVEDSYLGIADEASRLGFKGDTDLGGGLKAFIKYEATLDADGQTFSMNRDQIFGIKGGFGTVRMGRYNTAYKNAYKGMDIFSDSIGDITGTGTHGKLDNRHDNMLSYSNKFGAISVGVDMLFSESAASAADDGLALSVKWKGKGMTVSAAMVDQDDQDAAGSYDEGMRVGFQMKLGAGKLNVLYEDIDNAGTSVDPSIITAQYGMNMGKNMIGVSYTMVDGGGTNNDATQMTVGLHHNFSKSTKVAIAYTTIDNDAGSTATGRILSKSLGSSDDVAGGNDPSLLGVMFTHKF